MFALNLVDFASYNSCKKKLKISHYTQIAPPPIEWHARPSELNKMKISVENKYVRKDHRHSHAIVLFLTE